MNNYDLKGKVALVTGGSGGLGKQIAVRMLESGATVIFTGRNQERGMKAQTELSALGTAEYVCADSSKEEDVKALIKHIAEKYGKLDCVVNNAAGFNPNMPLHQVTSEEFSHVLATDVQGVFMVMKYAIEQMLTQEKRGCIVNISSCTSVHERAGLSPYQAAKAAVNSMTRTAALDYAKEGIRVNAVLPGMMETEALQAVRTKDPTMFAVYQSHIPTGCITTPREVGNTVTYLCTDDARPVTGALIVVDECASV